MTEHSQVTINFINFYRSLLIFLIFLKFFCIFQDFGFRLLTTRLSSRRGSMRHTARHVAWLGNLAQCGFGAAWVKNQVGGETTRILIELNPFEGWVGHSKPDSTWDRSAWLIILANSFFRISGQSGLTQTTNLCEPGSFAPAQFYHSFSFQFLNTLVHIVSLTPCVTIDQM